MFNKKITILIVTTVMISLIGGYKLMESQKINTYVEAQKPRIEKYLEYHYNNIESVTITGTKQNPMGGFSIRGYINDNPNLTISVRAGLGIDIEYVSGIPGYFYDKYKKEELGGKSKSVSEIEAEERNSLSFTEKIQLLQEKNNRKQGI